MQKQAAGESNMKFSDIRRKGEFNEQESSEVVHRTLAHCSLRPNFSGRTRDQQKQA